MKNKFPVSLLITDTHLHKNNVELVKKIFSQAIEICKKNSIQNIFHLGDFFTSREAQPLFVLKEAKEILAMIASNNLKLSIIPGNHDKTNLDDELSYLDVVEKNENIFLISQESKIEHHNLNVIFLPFFKENGDYLRRLENASKMIENDKFNILLTHVGINGVRNNDGSSVENNIKQDLFKKFEKVCVGHYHDQQSNKNIFYIGSSYQANFGEDNIKGFTILYSDGSHDFIKSNFPEFFKIKVNIDDKEELKNFEKKYSNSKDNIRIVLIGDKTKLQSFNKSNFIDKGIDVKFESEEINTNIDISNQEIILFNRSNIKDAYEKFSQINLIEDSEFGLEYLKKIL